MTDIIHSGETSIRSLYQTQNNDNNKQLYQSLLIGHRWLGASHALQTSDGESVSNFEQDWNKVLIYML